MKNFDVIKKTVSNKIIEIGKKVIPVTNALVMTALIAAPHFLSFADAGSTLIDGVVKMAGTVALILGIVMTIFGFIHYLAANGEGDGPAKNKAQAQIAGGVLLALGSFILSMVNWASLLPTTTP